MFSGYAEDDMRHELRETFQTKVRGSDKKLRRCNMAGNRENQILKDADLIAKLILRTDIDDRGLLLDEASKVLIDNENCYMGACLRKAVELFGAE